MYAVEEASREGVSESDVEAALLGNVNVANRESGQLDSYMRESCHARLTAWHAVHLKHGQSTANNK